MVSNIKINGERLRTARMFNQMTITELAEKLSVSKQEVCRYQCNQSKIPTDRFALIVRELGFPMSWYTGHDKAIIVTQSDYPCLMPSWAGSERKAVKK